MDVVDDGLYMSEVGRWSKRKYHFLGNYLNMFSTGMKNKWPERHYVDLFSGPVRIRSGEVRCAHAADHPPDAAEPPAVDPR